MDFRQRFQLVENDTAGLVRSDYATSGADVHADNKADVEELKYILQREAGLR